MVAGFQSGLPGGIYPQERELEISAILGENFDPDAKFAIYTRYRTKMSYRN